MAVSLGESLGGAYACGGEFRSQPLLSVTFAFAPLPLSYPGSAISTLVNSGQSLCKTARASLSA